MKKWSCEQIKEQIEALKCTEIHYQNISQINKRHKNTNRISGLKCLPYFSSKSDHRSRINYSILIYPRFNYSSGYTLTYIEGGTPKLFSC